MASATAEDVVVLPVPGVPVTNMLGLFLLLLSGAIENAYNLFLSGVVNFEFRGLFQVKMLYGAFFYVFR